MKFTRVIFWGLAFLIAKSFALATQPSISAGGDHSLFLKSDGTVWASGLNGSGALGNGTTTNLSTPVQVMTGVSAISAGSSYSLFGLHSLFLKSDGTVWASGFNDTGQLGNGTYTNLSTPVQVMTGVSAISAGNKHSLFLKSDGTVWATGANYSGQLGNGTTTNLSTPVQVMTGVSAISAGSNHSLFLKSDGTVWATGSNIYGELGDGTTTPRSTPVQVMSGVSAISAGGNHSLFLKSDGTVWTSGYNGSGALGNGTTTNLSTPVQVMTGVSAISAGGNHSLFLKSDGTVWASGDGSYGQLGNGTTFILKTPVQVMSGVSAISAGLNHSLLLKSDGTIWATGRNSYGQLGDGTTTDRRTPVQVMSLGPVIITQPQSIVSVVSGSASFSLIATGATSYQWQKNGVVITGATSATYTIPSVQVSDAGSYTCVVSDGVASATSNPAILTVNTSPQITVQPTPSVLAVSTQTVTLAVTASGTPAPLYQWQKDGVAIPSATSATLTLSGVQVSASGTYRCVVSNSVGSVNSTSCILTVYAEANLTIRTQPRAQALAVGNSFTLSVLTTSLQPITYQWLKGGVAISGATSSSYTIPSVAASDAGNYQCQVRDTDETLLSIIATLTVYTDTALTIRAQPAQQVIAVGNAATFSLIATSGEPIGYQWRKNGVAISGATSSSYTIPAVATSDAGTYSCIVSDYDELLLSSGATLTVQVPPAITSQPTSLTVLQNATAAFSVTATGTPAPAYQWQFNGNPITGATSASYTVASAQAANVGNYTCVVTNAAGSVTSNIATLTVNIPATITVQPSSQAVNPASSATFGVTATGTGTLSYQWRKNGRDIAGATASTLTLTNVRFLDEAKYACLVSNAFGTAWSTVATLTITISPTSPDSDGDGISDALETYLSVFGLDPAVNSPLEWARLLAMIPNLGTYYTADQMRNLAVGSPTLQRGANGNFLLDVTVQESTDLNTWTKRTLSAPMLTYPGGVLRLELPPLNSSTQFYRLRSQPAP